MAYSTVANVRKNTGLSNSTNISDAFITAKIAYADAVINSKIGGVYSLPLASTPDLIAFLSLEICSAMLYMGEYGEELQDSDKGWDKRMKIANDILDDIQSQKTKLYNTSTGEEYARASLLNPSFYPTEISSDPETEDSTAPYLTMNGDY